MTIALRTATASLVTLLAIATAWAQSQAPGAEVVRALRTGGHVIVFRHGATHADQADTDPLNPDNVAKQRHLNERGREFEIREGEASIFKPDGYGRYTLVGRVQIDQWESATR